MQKKKPPKTAALPTSNLPAANRKRAKRKQVTTAKRKRRSSDDILNRIVQAAAGEFKRCGFAGTTTAAIARKADVTEAQLFRYFGSKSNLFRETIFSPLDQHFRNFINEHMHDSGENVRKTTHLYTTELQRFISKHREMLTSLVVAQTYDFGSPHGVSEIDSLSTYFDRGASILKTRLKGEAKVDPKLMVRVSFVAVLACIMFKDWIFPPGLASNARITAAINDFVMEGVGADVDGEESSS